MLLASCLSLVSHSLFLIPPFLVDTTLPASLTWLPDQTSDFPTSFTEDLLDAEQGPRPIQRQHNDEVVHLRLFNGKTVKIKYTILALHSPVLRLEYEKTAPDAVLQVTGNEQAWKAIIELFEAEDDDGTRDVSPRITLDDVCSALWVATEYRMKVLEQALFLEAV